MEPSLAQSLGREVGGATAATEKRDLLARLLERLAHEIRNPLSSLDVHVQLLEEDLGTLAPHARDQLSNRLGVIRGELHRLDSIVARFLGLTGPAEVEMQPVDLTKVISHVCDLLRPEAARREIELIWAGGQELPEVMGDPVRLTQALVNLVINAMQAVERKGKIEVRVRADGPDILIEVHDTGPGIAAEHLGAIFDPYFTTKSEGHGLGLWIAQQIITAHQGRLSAQNHPAGGALLVVNLKAKTPSAEPSAVSDKL